MGTEVLDCVLDILGLLEAVGCRHLIIKINLLLVEDEDSSSCDNVACRIEQIPSPVDLSTILVIQFAILGLNDHLISMLVHFELSKHILNIKVRNLLHPLSRQSLPLPLLRLSLLWLRFLLSRIFVFAQVEWSSRGNLVVFLRDLGCKLGRVQSIDDPSHKIQSRVPLINHIIYVHYQTS